MTEKKPMELSAKQVEIARGALEKRIYTEPTTGCWLWGGELSGGGYGRCYLKGVGRFTAHRLSYRAFVGPIPPGLDLDHKCSTRACANPSHLEPVTQLENIRRGKAARIRKTHCPLGHPYAAENVCFSTRGNGRKNRYCRACANSRDVARRLRLSLARCIGEAIGWKGDINDKAMVIECLRLLSLGLSADAARSEPEGRE